MEDSVTLDVPSFSFLQFCLLLYFFGSRPSTNGVGSGFSTSGDKSTGGGVSPCAGSAEWLPYGTDRLWDLWVPTFAYVARLFDCFLSTLVQVYAAQGVCT